MIIASKQLIYHTIYYKLTLDLQVFAECGEYDYFKTAQLEIGGLPGDAAGYFRFVVPHAALHIAYPFGRLCHIYCAGPQLGQIQARR